MKPACDTSFWESFYDEFEDVSTIDDAVDRFCLILIEEIQSAPKHLENNYSQMGDFKTQVLDALNQAASGAPIDILVEIEGRLAEKLPDNPQVVSEFVKAKVNQIFDGLLSSSKKSEGPVDPNAPVLAPPQKLRADIIARIPSIELQIANVKLSLQKMVETVLSDRVMDKFYNNVFVPAKLQAAETAKSRIIPLAVGLFVVGGLTGGLITYFLTRNKNKKDRE